MLQFEFSSKLQDHTTSSKQCIGGLGRFALDKMLLGCEEVESEIMNDSIASSSSLESYLNEAFEEAPSDASNHPPAESTFFFDEFYSHQQQQERHQNSSSQSLVLRVITNNDMAATRTDDRELMKKISNDDSLPIRRNVHFAEHLQQTIEIPSHRLLDPEEKAMMYMSVQTIQAEANRNRREWDYERRCADNVVEESEFIPDACGNLWHPVHWDPII